MVEYCAELTDRIRKMYMEYVNVQGSYFTDEAGCQGHREQPEELTMAVNDNA